MNVSMQEEDCCKNRYVRPVIRFMNLGMNELLCQSQTEVTPWNPGSESEDDL